MSIPTSTDPRIERTHRHVLTITRELLATGSEAVTFTVVAEHAKVSRRTLYVHWGTVENLIAETLVVTSTSLGAGFDGLDLLARATLFLTRFADESDAAAATAAASIMASASYDAPSAIAVQRLREEVYDAFTALVGPATRDQTIQILGPVILQRMAGATVSPELIAELAERTVELLGA